MIVKSILSLALRAASVPLTAAAWLAAISTLAVPEQRAVAADDMATDGSIDQRLAAFIPNLEDYVSANMKSFDVPGLAIGIVSGNKVNFGPVTGEIRFDASPVTGSGA